MSKRTLVKTDDPKKQKFYIVVKGRVEKSIRVDPQALYLNGKPGDTLSAVITITPSEGASFSRLTVDLKPDSNIQASLVAPQNDEKSWTLQVTVQSDKVQHIYEKLTLKTDDPREPPIPVKVSANFSKGIK